MSLEIWNYAVEHGITAMGSGALAFAGAFFRFKQRLQGHEDALKKLAEELPKCRETCATEKRHQQELIELREKERASRPDPLEDIRGALHDIRDDLEKMKERGAHYITHDTFTKFTRDQEDQWRSLTRAIGRLEGAAK